MTIYWVADCDRLVGKFDTFELAEQFVALYCKHFGTPKRLMRIYSVQLD